MRKVAAGVLIALVALGGAIAAALLWNRLSDRPAREAGWETVAPLPVPRIEAAGTAVDGTLLVVSGFVDEVLTSTTRVDLYDPETDAWTRLSDIPTPLTHANVVVDGTRLWLAGGFQGDHPGPVTDQVWTYDLESDRWAPGPPLPEPRGAGALVLNQRKLHYFGGFLSDRETNSADHWTLDLDDASGWSPAPPMPAARGQLGAVSIDGEIYAVGGQFHHDSQPPVDLDLVHVYDPATEAWEKRMGLPIAVSHAEASTFVYRGRIYVVGGRSNVSNRRALDEIYLYDPALDQWIALAPLPRDLLGPVGNVVDGHLLVAGGSAWNYNTPQSTTWRRGLHDVWESGPAAPIALAEVAAGIIGKKLYLVGGPRPATLAYDLSRRDWTSRAALTKRLFPGDHHAAEVWNGRLYLFGGFGRAVGKTQVYDPVADTWAMGRDMPFAAGSSASALIDGRIYVAGGIVDGHTTDRAAVYDPARDEWTDIAPMPVPRNHAASATDGRRLYVFGGRGPGSGDGNVVANGFADTQVYDPETDTWESSADPDSPLRPLPQARGGMGKAVYAKGRFYVFGGETLDGPGANEHGTYDRVDIYDPVHHRWEAGTPMPTARHGIFPVVIADRVYMAAGGPMAGGSSSGILEVYTLP